MQKKLTLIIVGTIFVSFLALLVISTLSIRHFGMKNAEEKAETIAELVKDGLSVHMMNGMMDQREFFLKKTSKVKGVDSLWVVRSQSVIEQFGEGKLNERPRDAIDEQVLQNGQTYTKSIENSDATKLRVTIPYIAKENDTPNCFQCHNAKEGETLGVVSMVFDLGDQRIDGIVTSLVVLLFSLVIMAFVIFIINRTMKPLMDVFNSIVFVMNKAQGGDYQRRVRDLGKSEDCHRVTFLINSFLDKLEYTLADIEATVKKFLSLKPTQQEDMLIGAQKIVHELSDIYQFKRTIEFDESKEEVYTRIGTILEDTFELRDFVLAESGKNAIHPTIVYATSSEDKRIDPACRALRTKQVVFSNQFKNICAQCSNACEHFICVPYTISNNFELLLHVSATSAEDLKHIKEKLPQIQNYIDSARPELLSKDLMQILKISSTTDALTGLFNRKYLDEYIEKALSQAKRNGIVYGILMIDIDYFKMVNDTYGHDVGDKAIKILSKILQESIRDSDTVFRFGGEEFLVLLYQCDEAVVEKIAQKIRLAFEKAPIQASNGASFYKTLSVGASIFPKDADSIWKCIKYADIALYNAKENGRNCVKIFDENMAKNKEILDDF